MSLRAEMALDTKVFWHCEARNNVNASWMTAEGQVEHPPSATHRHEDLAMSHRGKKEKEKEEPEKTDLAVRLHLGVSLPFKPSAKPKSAHGSLSSIESDSSSCPNCNCEVMSSSGGYPQEHPG